MNSTGGVPTKTPHGFLCSPELQISNESVTYYASLVGYYSVYKWYPSFRKQGSEEMRRAA